MKCKIIKQVLGMRPHFFPMSLIFCHPEPPKKEYAIYPVFIPFSGCPQRCVFCAQERQTGKSPAPIASILQRTAKDLQFRIERGLPPVELGFFGGTFTALAPEDLCACLAFCETWRTKGAVSTVRCSTRPDAVSRSLLKTLASAGCTLVELGIQSFSTPALAAANRGYTREIALEGCACVVTSGLELGIQLMPGMPGSTLEGAKADLALAVSCVPSCVRLYPCLVLEGTALAQQWQNGAFTPWKMPATLDFLANACRTFWEANIPVIRMGIAQEPALEGHILAGPNHPALGSRVRGLALARIMQEHIQKAQHPENLAPLPPSYQEAWQHALSSKKIPPTDESPILYVPRQYQGEFWGHAKELVPLYQSMGIAHTAVVWWDAPCFAIVPRYNT